ncbi:sensor histidine kinase [Nocardia stercoris]|uniref:histidine kinase n=1 Tax=Nocardia stercoris TaxID=2483361 RepID=A0A3M2LDQ7_9NOCA|nr:sensor histidine kinase KdpD [Nocardia stercoris]RMI35544.1 sensor histidine kinase KdpD [Nocardia stercoris]
MKRGRLRIYLGAAPGVGKTYAMLGEAHRRLERGGDVVAAVVETHGRTKTAELLAGIEQVPMKEMVYRDTTLPELDVEAVLRRHPSVVLVDELAHTNVPGSKHEKRWQDVHELLDAGIDVISTVNIQHLESLNDVVEEITGVVQRETVPDSVVRGADQVELVDITPEALRRRLSHGNVYAAEKVDAALRNYFRPGNLTALRELALLWVADQVDAALAKYRADHRITTPWEARERVVVAVTGGPESETILRRASRIATKASAELTVVHVVRGDGLAGLSAERMNRLRELAAGLGASLHTVTGEDVPTALLDFARQIDATQLVLGTSRRSRWARMLDEGIGSATVQASGKIDVHMVTHEHSQRGFRWSAVTPRERRLTAWLSAFVVPILVTVVCYFWLDSYLDISGLSALYFIGVIAVALLGGVAPATLSAVLGGLLLNWFFVSPRYSLTIDEPNNFLTIVVMAMVAVAVAALVDVSAGRRREARRASRQAELLTVFAGAVLSGADLAALLERARETFRQRAVTLFEDGEALASVGEDPPLRPADADNVVEAGDDRYQLLLSGPNLTAGDRAVLRALASQAASLENQRALAAEAQAAAGLLEADRLRRALLSAVSHDLRTPLAAAKAAVSSLRSDDVEFSAADTAELLETIEESVDALTGLVGNLLDSSRLAVGVVKPQLRQVYPEEIINRAIVGIGARNLRRAAVERIELDVRAGSVYADPGLLERVLANLLENAVRYSPADTPIRVTAETTGARVSLAVIDHGPGVPAGQEEQVFEPFQRLGDRDNSTGVGLGLSVVRGFVEAMGGTVHAEPTPGGGLTMVVDLPATNESEDL